MPDSVERAKAGFRHVKQESNLKINISSNAGMKKTLGEKGRYTTSVFFIYYLSISLWLDSENCYISSDSGLNEICHGNLVVSGSKST